MTSLDAASPPRWDRIARETTHRPWPPPARPWLLTQTWTDLLFAHWPVPPAMLRPLVPAALTLDTFAGEAWIGVVAFRLARLAPRGAPRPLGLAFPELNLRTYVSAADRPGIWFFSLDAASALAVVLARATFHLPYYWARMTQRDDGDGVAFASHRHRRAPAAAFVGRYQPIGPVFESVAGSLERWLTARYCLYAADRAGRLHRGEINHVPWPLQCAEAEIVTNTLAAVHGIGLAGPPQLHFARRLDMVAWGPERLDEIAAMHA
jgi:uncharacterized protein